MFDNRNCSCNMPNMCGGPIMEPPVEKCVQKDIIHEIEHICPVHTKVINNHIYKHTYTPQYTCSEEDIVTNVDECGGCSKCNY